MEVNLGDYHCVGLYLLTSDEVRSATFALGRFLFDGGGGVLVVGVVLLLSLVGCPCCCVVGCCWVYVLLTRGQAALSGSGSVQVYRPLGGAIYT